MCVQSIPRLTFLQWALLSTVDKANDSSIAWQRGDLCEKENSPSGGGLWICNRRRIIYFGVS